MVSTVDPLASVRSRLGGSVRLLIAGDSEPRTASAPSDEGLFDADSVVRRVHQDPAMFIGGLRALLLQTLHPRAMAGVADHSDYRTDPWGRLRRTGQFLGVTTYGSAVDAHATIDRIRRIHERVTGVTPEGEPYSATDPHLLTWVHVTEVDSFLAAHQRYGRDHLTPADADRYVAEMAIVARLLGAEDVPETVAELRSWLVGIRPELRAGGQARDAVRFLLVPPLPLVARPAYAVIAAASIGLLPGWSRRMLWLPVAPLSDPLVVRPAARALVATLGWALDPTT